MSIISLVDDLKFYVTNMIVRLTDYIIRYVVPSLEM